MIARILAPLAAVIVLALPVLPARAEIEVQQVTSPGGIEAWLVQDPSIPFMAIDLWFQGGGLLDEPDRRGATYLMSGLLEEGAGDMDSAEFSAALEGLAAYVDFGAYREEMVISARMLSVNRDQAVEILREALVNPSFEPAAFERVRGQVLSIIEDNLRDPDSIAGASFAAMAFGDHPFASGIEGTQESVAALTREDVVAAHARALVRDRVSVGVAGDITPEDLGVLLDRLLGDLPLSEAPLPAAPVVDLAGGVTVIDFPTPQSSVLFGHSGIARFDPDFFPAFVLNEVLGAGGFRSRLMREVRVERGLTYGISTWLDNTPVAPMFQGAFSSSNDVVAEAIAVVRAEWAEMAANGITDAELEAAQRFLTGEYPLRFSGNADIATILAAMQHDDLPVDYIENRNGYVMAVTVEDVRRVAARLMRPEALHFVVVGRPEGISSSD